MSNGRIEQAGTPDDLYERPANAFVMGFVGPVTRLGEQWLRPHDLEVHVEPEDGAVQAMIQRVARLGFETRLEAVTHDGQEVVVQLTRHEATVLEVAEGDVVWLRAHRVNAFAA
jgi:sulfate transport system ATP-binding protein